MVLEAPSSGFGGMVYSRFLQQPTKNELCASCYFSAIFVAPPLGIKMPVNCETSAEKCQQISTIIVYDIILPALDSFEFFFRTSGTGHENAKFC
jgi:hypothetical protein